MHKPKRNSKLNKRRVKTDFHDNWTRSMRWPLKLNQGKKLECGQRNSNCFPRMPISKHQEVNLFNKSSLNDVCNYEYKQSILEPSQKDSAISRMIHASCLICEKMFNLELNNQNNLMSLISIMNLLTKITEL